MAAGPAAVSPGARVRPRAGCGPAARPRRQGREAPARRRSRHGQPGDAGHPASPGDGSSKTGRDLRLCALGTPGGGAYSWRGQGPPGVPWVSGGSGRDRVARLIYRSRQQGPTLG
jgi:hypothetical protein